MISSVLCVVGARPNFMKMAPIFRALQEADALKPQLVHTGQHYDDAMSDQFFRELGIPDPDVHLSVGSGSHAEQTASVMTAFEQVCLERRPDWVLVVGDVNSTLACALTARKLGIKVAHVEAGLRSRDFSMPEEINRICTDAISNLLFTTEEGAAENLISEGVPAARIVFAGNVMIDSLFWSLEAARAKASPVDDWIADHPFALATLHRPSNVDFQDKLSGLLKALIEVSRRCRLVLPLHPRTAGKIKQFGLDALLEEAGQDQLRVTGPLGYLDMVHLMDRARLVLTDSGGIQEETSALGTPCITIRENTERPITISLGTNRLVGTDPDAVVTAAFSALNEGTSQPAPKIPFWDGRASLRIAGALECFGQSISEASRS